MIIFIIIYSDLSRFFHIYQILSEEQQIPGSRKPPAGPWNLAAGAHLLFIIFIIIIQILSDLLLFIYIHLYPFMIIIFYQIYYWKTVENQHN